MNWNWNSKNILPSCLISLLSLALSSPEGNKLFANGTKLCSSSPGQVRGREEGFSCREEDQGWHQACQLPLQTSFWTCHGPQRSLKGLSKIPQRSLDSPAKGSQRSFEQAMAFEGSSKVPHRALKDLFKHTMAFEGYLQWWTSSSPARSQGPSSWSSPSRPCPQSSSSCRSSSQLGRHFLRCS